VTSLLVVFGIRSASVQGGVPVVTESVDVIKKTAFGIAATFAAFCALGPSILHLDPHTPFLFDVGELPATFLPSSFHVEPINALTIPTWAIHFSSVFEVS